MQYYAELGMHAQARLLMEQAEAQAGAAGTAASMLGSLRGTLGGTLGSLASRMQKGAE